MAVDHSFCLYWSKKKNECLLTKNGVFIPMPSHIKMYCVTEHFYRCQHYVKGSKLLDEVTGDFPYKFGGGRRRYHREKKRFSVFLKTCDSNDNPSEILDEEAYVVDFGVGGIGLESSKEIPPTGLLAFTFGPDFIIPDLQGIGEVRWSGPVPDADAFQAGLSFVDNAIVRSLGAHMGLPNM